MPSEKETPKFPYELPLLLGLVTLALCLRIRGLDASFYGDEFFSLLRDSNTWLTPTEDRFRPLYFTLLYCWKQLGFHGEVGLRSLSVVFGVLQVPVAYSLTRRLAGWRVATVCALLVAVDPVLIEFSQELRMYSLVPLIALLQAWAFVEIVARSSEGRPVRVLWLGFVLAGFLGVYTHLHYWLFLAGFAFAIWRRRRTLPLWQGAAALAAIAVLYLPDVPNVLRFQRQAGGAAHLLSTDLPSALPKLLTALLVGFNYFHVPDMGLERAVRLSSLGPNIALAILVGIPTVIVVWQWLRQCASRDPGPLVWLSVELFAVPVLVSIVLVLVTRRDFIHPKYMVFSAPFFSLALAAGYVGLRSRVTRIGATVLGLGAFATAFVHFNQPTSYGRRESWREAAESLRPALGNGSELVMLGDAPADGPASATGAPGTTGAPGSLWEYYAPDLYRRTRFIHLPRGDARPDELAATAQELAQGKRDIFYLWSDTARNFEDPHDVVLAAARSLWVNEERTQLNPRLILYHWSTK